MSTTTTSTSLDDVSELRDRLLASRYGELACLRQLSVVAKQQAPLESLIRRRAEGAWRRAPENGEGIQAEVAPAEEQATVTRTELDSVGAARRVTGLALNFRRSLEAAVGRSAVRPSARPATPRHENVPAQQVQSVQRPSSVPALLPPTTIEEANDSQDRAHVIWSTEDAFQAERAVLEAGAPVRTLLSDASFISRLSRVLNPSLRHSRPSLPTSPEHQQRLPPPPPPRAPPPARPQHGSLDNLTLVQGASFELLLSIQRMLQQDLGAALAHEAGLRSAFGRSEHAHADEGPDSEAGTTTTIALPHRSAQPNNFRLGACVVCTEEEVGTVFYRCGHLCTCNKCALHLKQRGGKCPICRSPIRDIVQAFLACAPDAP